MRNRMSIAILLAVLAAALAFAGCGSSSDETTTDGALAERVGHPRAARAVGTVMNRNRIPIVLPCHRVVGATGDLTGYAGGLDRKVKLLELEGAR